MQLTYRNRDDDFKYEVSANLSTVRNRVTSLGFGTDSYISGAYITNVGEEIGKFYGWVYDGIARTQADLTTMPHKKAPKLVTASIRT